MDLRWGGGDINRMRALAQQFIMTGATLATAAVQRETLTIPIVFANGGDPVASGLVPRLDRPSGNITGFANLEASLGGKWLELLSEIAPGLKRAAIMFNPDTSPASAYMPSLLYGIWILARVDDPAGLAMSFRSTPKPTSSAFLLLQSGPSPNFSSIMSAVCRAPSTQPCASESARLAANVKGGWFWYG
jgi:hypothetical protein